MTTNKPKVARITGITSLELDGCRYKGKIDPCYFRPTEVKTLLGEPAKAIANGYKFNVSVEQA